MNLSPRTLALSLLASSLLSAGCAGGTPAPEAPFDVAEATIADMQRAMEEGRVTSRQLVEAHLQRIALHEERLNAIISVHPRVLEEADRLDRERAEGRVRGPLHGIPIALKDNIHTIDIPTTGGALAFDGYLPPYDATVTRNLREAGAVIIAKTVLTELANWMAGAPTPMPANYSAVGGFGMNPYDPRPDPREGIFDGRPVLGTGGSSSGIGTAASFWAANVGTETSGSILSPANQNMLVGIKPTVGRVSRYGIIPITGDQDTAGPMARTVADAAALLGALEGEGADPADPATGVCERPAGGDYTAFLNPDGLRGARIGIPRAFFYDAVTVPGANGTPPAPRGGLSDAARAVMAEAIAVLEAQGAVIVDPADIPSVINPDPAGNFLLWGTCTGIGADPGCSSVFKYGMKRDFNAWLATLGPDAPVTTLTALREWNLVNQRAGSMKFGQSLLDASDDIDLERDRARYEADRARDIELGGALGIDAAMAQHELDALLFPSSSGAGISARPGYPTVIVPFGTVPNAPNPALPDGFDARPAPFGVSFAGGSCSEPRLIELAYAFEQATRRRVPPPLP